jgi:hypothetical protein
LRYNNSENISFTDADGNTVSIKAILPVVAKADTVTKVECNSNTSLEEIASRDSIYGAGSESSSYKIFDENIIELVDARFDMGKIRTLRIPT